MRTSAFLILFILFLGFESQAQILKDIAKAKDKIAGITVDKLSRDPITTSFKDVDKQAILPESFATSESYANLHAQPFNPETGFSLAPGHYQGKMMSFCIKAGTYMPTQGGGRFYAEMKGPKADIFETILTALHTDRSLTRQEVQLLLWAIIAKTDFQKMKGPVKVTALKILSAEQLARLSKGALDNIAQKKLKNLAYKNDALRSVIEAENNLRAKFYKGVSNYAEFEEVAMLAGVEPVVSGYESGKWSKHPDGYYVRYYPYGFSRTKTQVYVPESSGTVIFNAFGDIAVPASTGSQRLLQTNIPYGDDDWSYGNPTFEDPTTEPKETEKPEEVLEEVDEEEEPNNAKKLPCEINSDTVLINGPDEVDYIVDCVVDVTAKLTINPGVVIEFKSNAGLGVYNEGQLLVNGSATEKVIFRGSIANLGHWRGIHLEGAATHTIKYLQINHAGSNYVYCCNDKAAIYVKGNVSLTKSTIADNNGCGVFIGRDGSITENGNLFNNNTDGNICYGDPIKLSCEISADKVLKNTPKPVDYIVDCVVDITAALTIEEGVVIEFKENAGLGVYDSGSLSIQGTAANQVILRGKENLPGYWRGIHTETNSTRNKITYTSISNAGSNYVYCCNEKAALFVKKGSMILENSTIENNGGCAVIVGDDSTFTESSNTYNNNMEGNICYGPPKALPSNIAAPMVLKNTPKEVDYVVNANTVVDITSSLTVEAGVVIEFKENAGLGVYDSGSLSIQGTAANQVILRGKENLSGYWRGIHTETNSARNKITYTSISNAGSNYVYCCNEKAALFVKKGSMILENSTIENNGGCAVIVGDDSTFTESSNTYNNNMEGQICYGPPKALPSNIAAPMVLKNTPKEVDYVVNANTVVDITSSLTIEAGVVIEMGNNAGLGVYNDGQLTIQGNGADYVIIRGKVPVPGQWRGIHLETNGNSISHARIQHAGSNYVYCCNQKAAILVKDGTTIVSNSIIHDNEGCAIIVKDDANLSEAGNTFTNNADGNICN